MEKKEDFFEKYNATKGRSRTFQVVVTVIVAVVVMFALYSFVYR